MCGHLGCVNLVRAAHYCDDHKREAWQHSGSGRKKTAAYQRKRMRVLGRDSYRCRLQYPGLCQGAATEVDHRIPAVQGGTDDDNNLQAACSKCHAHKSSMEGHHERWG